MEMAGTGKEDAIMLLVLLLLWFIFNGKITFEIFMLGVLICGGVYAFMVRFMEYSPKKEWNVIRHIPLFVKYGVILVWEVIKSNLAVMRIILSPGLDAEPGFRTFEVDLDSQVARVTLANSITLTPGTYTVSLEENRYTIHALDMSFTENAEDSIFVKQLRKLEE